MKEGERGNVIMQERREDFARDRGNWRREKEMDLIKERRRKQKPFHSTSSTLHHYDQKENLRTTFAKTNPRREKVRGRRSRRKAEEEPLFSVSFLLNPARRESLDSPLTGLHRFFSHRFFFEWAPLKVLWTAH